MVIAEETMLPEEPAEGEVEVDEEDQEGMGDGEMAPKPTKHFVELEQDDSSTQHKPVAYTVALNGRDSTPDALYSEGNHLLTSLSSGGFKHLMSSMRANTGVKGGRYLFEVQIVEVVPNTPYELRVGLSSASSSLFLGDGSPDNVCYSNDGIFYSSELGRTTPFQTRNACAPMPLHSVVGVLINLDQSSPGANTLSVFIDGVRAGEPQQIPNHLHNTALYPTFTFRNLTLGVNFGQYGKQLRCLPFRCRMLSEIAEAHHERIACPTPDANQAFYVPIGLPGEGFFDFVDYLMEKRPDCVELSDRRVLEWCYKSGLAAQGDPGPTNSRDSPDFLFGPTDLDSKSWRHMLKSLAHLTTRNHLVAELASNLCSDERQALLSKIPRGQKKIALVAIGEPSSDFRSWVHQKIKANYKARKELVEQRKKMAEASGEILSEKDLELPPEPVLKESVWFLPSLDTSLPDLSEKVLTSKYAKFPLPSASEGFDEIRYEWQDSKAAEAHLRKWVLERKSTLKVEGLTPGSWFQGCLKAWQEMRVKLRTGHGQVLAKQKQAKASGDEILDIAGSLDPNTVEDIHNSDGQGTPIYANFKYEDWLLLSWRYELHLLAHTFIIDVDDPDRPGIPEEHIPHYYALYHGTKCDPGKLGVQTVPQLLKLLKEPVELVTERGSTILKSKIDKDTAIDYFVKRIEVYRRDRNRRIEAGDESAQLSFPKPAKAPPKAPVKPGTGATVVKEGVTPAKAGAKAVVKSAANANSAPKVATRAMLAPASAGGEATAVKRPAPQGTTGEGPALKKACADGAAATAVRGQAIVKRASGEQLAKAPVAKKTVAKRKPGP